MGDVRGLQTDSGGGALAATADEKSRLDAMLSDDRLMAWLDAEEQRRRRIRRRTMIGVILMTISLTALATWLTFTAYMGPIQNPAAVHFAQQGWKLWQAGDAPAAEVKFVKAVELDPKYDNAWSGLGWSRMNQGKAKEAEVAFLTCVKLAPQHLAAHNGLGWVYFGRREYEKAESEWLPIADQAPAAWTGLAKVYLLTGKWDEAAKWSRKASKQMPADKTLKLMVAAAEARKLDNSLRSELEPFGTSEGGVATREGWKFFMRGRYRDAQKAFEKAVAAEPGNAAANNGLGFCLLNLGKHAEAKRHFKKALETWPDGTGPLNGLARCLKAEGKTDEAIETWKKVANDKAPNAGNYGLAETYLELGRYKEAAAQWELIVKAQPENNHAQEALKRARQGLEDE